MTATYLDDTPVTSPEGFFTNPPDFYLVDMNRVEVLHGPQGTLFGSSSMGGAVRNITNRPDAANATLSRLSYGPSGNLTDSVDCSLECVKHFGVGAKEVVAIIAASQPSLAYVLVRAGAAALAYLLHYEIIVNA